MGDRLVQGMVRRRVPGPLFSSRRAGGRGTRRLRRAPTRRAAPARRARPGLPRPAGDMRCLPFAAASFDWVLNFFTSFGYFEKERENFQVLEEIVRVLVPDGRFLIDIMNSANTL